MIVTVLAMIAVMVVIIMSVVTGTDPAVISTHLFLSTSLSLSFSLSP